MTGLRLDLGCGAQKQQGTLGLDMRPGPGVDHVLDFTTDPLPFPDASVEYVHSSHCLEHLTCPIGLFTEISRVCQDGARLEFWTPYGWENSAFIMGHRSFYNEDHYLHLCLWYVDTWKPTLKKRWLLHEIVYVVEPHVLRDLFREGVSLDFAIKYYKGVVKEFGVFMEVRRDLRGPVTAPRRSFSTGRVAERYPLPPVVHPLPVLSPGELFRMATWLRTFSGASAGRPRASVGPRGLPSFWILTRHAGAVARNEGVLAMLQRACRYVGTRLGNRRDGS